MDSQHAEEVRYEGKVKASPSTLFMDGTSPVVVYIRATTDELRAMHNKVVTLIINPQQSDGRDDA
jgi:hypothetical protein